MTPYEIVYERPPQLYYATFPKLRVQSVKDNLYDRARISKLLKDHFNQARNRMKLFADRKRTERNFDVEERVLLKIHPYK